MVAQSEIATLDVQLNLLGADFTKSLDQAINRISSSVPKKFDFASEFNKNLDQINTKSVQSLFPNVIGAIPTAENIKKLATEYNSLSETFGRNSAAARVSRRNLEQVGAAANFTSREINNVIKRTEVLNFNFLTLLFAGMMLQRTFGGALRSIVTDYQEITDKQTAFSKSTTKLGANFSFLKFQIGRALDQPFVIDAVETLSDLIQDLADVLEQNPAIATGILGISAALFALGTVGVLASSAIQLGKLVKELGLLFSLDFLTKGKAAIEGIKNLGLLKPVVVTVGIAAAAFTLLDTFKLLGDDETSILQRISNLTGWVITGAAIGSIFPGIGTAVGAAAGLAIGLTINAVDIALESGALDGTREQARSIWADQIIPFLDNAWDGFQKDVLGRSAIEINPELFPERIGGTLKEIEGFELGIGKTELETMETFREELLNLDSTRLQQVIGNYDLLKLGMDSVIDTSPLLIEQLIKTEEEFEKNAEATSILKDNLNQIASTLNNLNGKTFSFTVNQRNEGVNEQLFTPVRSR